MATAHPKIRHDVLILIHLFL